MQEFSTPKSTIFHGPRKFVVSLGGAGIYACGSSKEKSLFLAPQACAQPERAEPVTSQNLRAEAKLSTRTEP